MDSLEKTKERYHFAKLALFNIRLLNKFQRTDDEDPTKQVIVNEAKANGMVEVPSLLNQGTFSTVFIYVSGMALGNCKERRY